jgi:hypothetical protein
VCVLLLLLHLLLLCLWSLITGRLRLAKSLSCFSAR